MPIVFVIARDWTLRAMVRAELCQRGIDARGMQTADEAGAQIASGVLPSVAVLEAGETVDPGLESLARRVPIIVVVSGIGSDVWPEGARVLRRPVRVAEIVAAVFDVLRGRPA